MIGRQLLDLSFDPRLFGIFDEDVGAQQDVAVKLGLARAVASDRVDVHAGPDHVVGQDRRALLVGGDGGDDVRAFHRVLVRRAARHG